jgi:hypothetical protein
MAKLITKANEYGQLELNQVAFRRDGRIIAQYALDEGIEYVENGMLLAVDYVNKTIKYPTAGQKTDLALNYTTEHMYDERLAHGLKHFKLDNGTFLPRLGLLATGDRFTTNAVDYNTTDFTTLDALKSAIADGTPVYGCAGTNGYIAVTKTATNAVLRAIEFTTMPDGSDAIKFVAM